MTLDAALALIDEVQANNGLLREQVALLQAENAALPARMAALEQRIAELEAEKRPSPPWVRANQARREKAEGESGGSGHPSRTRGVLGARRPSACSTSTSALQTVAMRCADGR